MKERPINLREDEVRGIKEGRKTQIRRAFKYAEHPAVIGYEPNGPHGWWKGTAKSEAVIQQYISTFPLTIKCPFGIVGDRLWVRETFSSCFEVDIPQGRPVGAFDTKGSPAKPEWKTRFIYKADGPMPNVQWSFVGDSSPVCWQSPIFMPRIASRILLEIINIRVERLQDISEEDATAEGMIADDDYCAEQYYSIFWNTKHGWKEKGWNANPWVWVVEFNVIQGGAA